ncbi:hypothetical protein B0J11DRAFT_601657 [Dendryphion nanum]|uniref:C2H2-type domain-containing protein n=1 Tax=Dendryphion nanum TaxID=256645 RepID=A0A9P9CZ26_9PLEO|nr:hypothetical protein B0J11DRAFT_601657 [Dendryphion nanum]
MSEHRKVTNSPRGMLESEASWLYRTGVLPLAAINSANGYFAPSHPGINTTGVTVPQTALACNAISEFRATLGPNTLEVQLSGYSDSILYDNTKEFIDSPCRDLYRDLNQILLDDVDKSIVSPLLGSAEDFDHLSPAPGSTNEQEIDIPINPALDVTIGGEANQIYSSAPPLNILDVSLNQFFPFENSNDYLPADLEHLHFTPLELSHFNNQPQQPVTLSTLNDTKTEPQGPLQVSFQVETVQIRKFVCTYDQCNKKYSRLAELHRHYRGEHEGKRPYRCRTIGCPRSVHGFPRMDKRADHEKSKHGGTPYARKGGKERQI